MRGLCYFACEEGARSRRAHLIICIFFVTIKGGLAPTSKLCYAPLASRCGGQMYENLSVDQYISKGWIKVANTHWWVKFPKDGTHPFHWRGHLRHECRTGKLRGVSSYQYYSGKKTKEVYAYCGGCRAKLPTSIKAIIKIRALDL